MMGRWGGYGRRTVEQTCSLDINELRRSGYVGKPPGSWWVARNILFQRGFAPRHWNDDAITLDAQTLRITYVPWHFGGRRAYFLCGCGRRVGTLFAPRGRPWRCRHCYDLTYATRQAAPHHRRIIQAQKIRQRLGGSASLLEDFPPKPKGMHWKRYNHLRKLYNQTVDIGLAAMAVRIHGLRRTA
jgi:hypothetical protein